MKDQSGLFDDYAYHNICDRREILLNALKVITQRWLIKAVVASPSGILIMIMACVKKKGTLWSYHIPGGARTELNLGVC